MSDHADCRARYDALRERHEALREALRGCVKWIEPVMDGMGVPASAYSRSKILAPARALLADTQTGAAEMA